jgi:hypothetical protein
MFHGSPEDTQQTCRLGQWMDERISLFQCRYRLLVGGRAGKGAVLGCVGRGRAERLQYWREKVEVTTPSPAALPVPEDAPIPVSNSQALRRRKNNLQRET